MKLCIPEKLLCALMYIDDVDVIHTKGDVVCIREDASMSDNASWVGFDNVADWGLDCVDSSSFVIFVTWPDESRMGLSSSHRKKLD